MAAPDFSKKRFWADAFERAVRTFAQALAPLLVLGEGMTILDIDWAGSLSASALAALISLLTSVGAKGQGNPDSPALVQTAANEKAVR